MQAMISNENLKIQGRIYSYRIQADLDLAKSSRKLLKGLNYLRLDNTVL